MSSFLITSHILLVPFVFLLGASIGSFVNVLIDRLPQPGLSITTPRQSFCMSCKHTLAWYDLIPIVSWCVLRGRCRYCQAKIPARILVVEFLLGAFALACYFRFGAISGLWPALEAVDAFIVVAILFAVIVIDWNWWIIPMSLPIALAINGVIFRGLVFEDPWFSLAGGAFFGLLLFGGLLVISTWFMRRKGRINHDETTLGWGDVWLAMAIGANVGIVQFPWVMILASVQAILAWIVLHFLEKYSKLPAKIVPQGIPKNAIPFGAFLAIAAIEARLIF